YAPRERRQDRGLVAAAGPDLEHLLGRASDRDRLGHACDDVRLRDRLAMADRQRGVLVRAARERLIDEEVARDVADAVQHARVAEALRGGALDEAPAGG